MSRRDQLSLQLFNFGGEFAKKRLFRHGRVYLGLVPDILGPKSIIKRRDGLLEIIPSRRDRRNDACFCSSAE